MSAYKQKTKKSNVSVSTFLHEVEDPQKRTDAKRILKIMKEITGKSPKMWGKSIVGFGEYSDTYSSGHSGSWMRTGFSPRKQNLTIYIMPGHNLISADLKKLGPYKTGKSCLYIKRLKDIDIAVLKKIIKRGYSEMEKRYPTK